MSRIREYLDGIAVKAVMTLARGMGLANPELYRWAGEGESYSGKRVTVDAALQLDAVWACVRLISETAATLPLSVFERGSDGRKEAARDHPLYTLLHDAPNADMTASEFWEAMIACLLLWGNAYAEKELVFGRVVSLTPLRPDCVEPKRAGNGAIYYVVTENGRQRTVSEDRIFHLKGFTLDGLIGLSPVGQARHTLGLASAAEETAGKLFANGLRATGYLAAPTYLTPDQRKSADALLDRYRGYQNAGKTPVLEGGWKFESVTMPPQEAELLATRKFSVETIARWYRVPAHMIGHTQPSTTYGTGLEQMSLGFLTYTLRPYLTKIEQAVKKSLLSAVERGRYFAEFNLEGLMRADSAGRASLYSVYAQNGIMSRNEIRSLENLPPLPGGDDLTAQSNLLPLEKLGQDVQPKQQPAVPAVQGVVRQ